MITSGPFAWSQRLRYCRSREQVVLRDSGVSVVHVLNQFAKGGEAVKELMRIHTDIVSADIKACLSCRNIEIDNPSKGMMDTVEFLRLDDETAAQPSEFFKQLATEVKGFREARIKVESASEICVSLHHELADLITPSLMASPRPAVLLETLLRIAARSQIAIEDLRLVERAKEDSIFPF